MNRFKSRKFLMSLASVLASVGTALCGLATGNDNVLLCGTLCTALSSGIYTFCEASVDKKSLDL